MYIPFDEMPGHSRIWVYTCNRHLNGKEEQIVKENLTRFCEQWAAHGQPLNTSWLVWESRFILLAADEKASAASGCSIDTSTRLMSGIGSDLGADFFDRSVAFLIENEVILVSLKDLGEAFRSKRINGNTLAFPQQAATKEEWLKGPVPVASTWMKRYLPTLEVKGDFQAIS